MSRLTNGGILIRTLVDLFFRPALLMWILDYLHGDYPVVPAPGYWMCFAIIVGVQAIIEPIGPRAVSLWEDRT